MRKMQPEKNRHTICLAKSEVHAHPSPIEAKTHTASNKALCPFQPLYVKNPKLKAVNKMVAVARVINTDWGGVLTECGGIVEFSEIR